MFAIRGVCRLLLLLVVVLQTDYIVAQQSVPPSPPVTAADLAISPGDLVHLSVLGAPEFDHDARVSASGQISLPSVGELTVAGLSPVDAERRVAQRLESAGMFVAPQVTLSIKEYASLGISVLGEVQKPGIYLLLGERSLFDALSAAGGVTPKAGKFVTISHRDAKEQTVTVAVSNSPDGKISGNVPLRPGDTLVVSKAGIVYVVGDVRQPAGIVMDNPELTVLQALAVAQGANPTASLNNTRLLRKAPDGTKEIPVPLKQILAAQAPDMQLQPDDVLFIPNSAAKSIARRSLEAVLQTATGVVIYRR